MEITYGFLYLAIITLLVVIMQFVLGALVGLSRSKHKLLVPKMTGNAEVERHIRVHENTNEYLLIFLSLLWLSGILVNTLLASVFGVIWFLARVNYARLYYKSSSLRHNSFKLSILVIVILALITIYGIILGFLNL